MVVGPSFVHFHPHLAWPVSRHQCGLDGQVDGAVLAINADDLGLNLITFAPTALLASFRFVTGNSSNA